ncbi:hypothetical protein [uncultured Eubacterium sp.]|uniref:hypothetical protein n=2 Tax=uncultured Eubacterium sp. TaxID=165185 RepID=UPI0025DE82EF|nr:hypothetical protein [uncultured Eubacterium sp.]
MNNYFNSYQSCKVPEVNGMNGANAYQIGVNSSVLLLDTNLPIVYLKQTDGGGYATVSAFDLVPHKDTATKTIEDINSRLDRLEELIREQVTNAGEYKQSTQQSSGTTGNAIMQNAGNDTRAISTTNGTTKRN